MVGTCILHNHYHSGTDIQYVVPRLVTMGDVVDKLWDKADDELDDDRESVMSAMR